MTADAFPTLTFSKTVAAPQATLWQAWTATAARSIWASPAPGVTVDFIEADFRTGGREVSLCKVAGQPDIRVEAGWLEIRPARRCVNYEVVSCEGETLSVALVTAELAEEGAGSRIDVTVQLSAPGGKMEAGYRQGFGAGMTNLAELAGRTMVLERVIAAPVSDVWGAWVNPETLPRWWGPNGFTCRTARIDLRSGGEWVFDMIAPDGTVYPNHHRYGEVLDRTRLRYSLHWGENGPKHADAWAAFEDIGEQTRVTLGMVFATAEEFANARGFGAIELGMQTLGKLAAFVGAD